MTSSENADLYVVIPLPLSIPTTHTLTALASHKGELVIGLNPLLLYFLQCQLSLKVSPTITSHRTIQLQGLPPDSTIDRIGSMGDSLLLHLIFSNNRHALYLLHKTNKPIRIPSSDKSADIKTFAVNQFSPIPLFAYSIDKTVYVRSINRNGSIEKSSEQQFTSPILSLAFNYPDIWVITNDCTYLMHIDKASKPDRCQISCPFFGFALALPNKVFICADVMGFVLDGKLSARGATIAFNEQPLDHAFSRGLVGSVVADGVKFADFERNAFVGLSFIARAKTICSLGDFFLVGTERTVSALINGFEVMEHDDWAPKSFPEFPLALIDQLWMSGSYRTKALKMLANEKFGFAWKDVLRLFPFLVLPDDLPARLLAPQGAVAQGEALALAKVLMKLRITEDVVLLNSVVLQLLAYSEDYVLFVRFVDEKSFNVRLVEEFFRRTKSRLYPHYLCCARQFAKALENFRNQGDQVGFRDALVSAGADFSVIEANVEWLLRENPLLAFSVFADPRVRGHTALQFFRDHHPHYYFAVLGEVLKQKGIPDRDSLVKSYVFALCGILANIGQPAFDRRAIVFCEPFILNSDVDLATVANWITDRLAATCSRDRQFLPVAEMQAAFHDLPLEVKFLLYRKLGAVAAAMALLREWQGDVAPFEALCAENPQFFSALFADLKSRFGPVEFRDRICRIIADHLFVVDVPAALACLGDDVAVGEVAACLERAFAALSARRIASEMRAAFLEADEFESAYERTVIEATVVELGQRSVCARCQRPLGFNSVERQPGGQMFHGQCVQGIMEQVSGK